MVRAVDCDLVVGDWGSTHLRLWGLKEHDVVTECRTSSPASGSGAVVYEKNFISALAELNVQCARRDFPPILLSGMVGSREGWREIKYCERETLNGLVGHKIEVSRSNLDVWIVPGICQLDPPDVMRGEETQLLGLLRHDPQYSGFVCLPGTHTKWAELVGGRLKQFKTIMTGEIFDLLTNRSVLRHSLSPKLNEHTFINSFNDTLVNPSARFSGLFELRSSDLLKTGVCDSITDAISGVLIGLELKSLAEKINGQLITIVGDGHISSRYKLALEELGCTVMCVDGRQASLAGLVSIATNMRDQNAL